MSVDSNLDDGQTELVEELNSVKLVRIGMIFELDFALDVNIIDDGLRFFVAFTSNKLMDRVS